MTANSGHRSRILVVDDAVEYLELVAGALQKEGYEVLEAQTGREALDAVDRDEPDLVVLDLTLPDLDGMEVCRQIRERSNSFVVMLTARDDEVDRVMGLKIGADDYVTKPFSIRELAARIEAILRRGRGASEPDAIAERAVGDLKLRPQAREVEVSGSAVELTRIEFDILETLTQRPEMVFTRAQLREQVWGPNWFGDDHVVDVHIANLRKKIDLGDGPSRVRTVRGVGYRMEV